MTVDNTLDGCQTNSASRKLTSVMQTLESAKKLVGVLHIEPHTVIAHKVDCPCPFVLHPEFDTGIGLLGSKLPGIGKEVFEHQP
jgi:hypothetical protein